jgi:vitamin B12 transporter
MDPRRFDRRARRHASLLFAVALATAPSAAAQVTASLGSLFVTATRSAQPIEHLVADVTVIEAEEIARSGAQSLADLLQRQPGIEITQNGSPASTTGVFIRGANRGQTVLLVDGMRVGSASVGAPSFEAVPLGQVERIEILRGPASSLYGADAIGGVVQVFTREPVGHGVSLNATAGYGTYDTRVLNAGGSVSAGPLRVSLQAGGRRSDGFDATTPDASFIVNPDRDGYESDDVGANAFLTVAPGHELSAQLLRNRLDAQFDGGPGFDDRTSTTLTTWRLQTRNQLHDRWTSRLWLGEGRDHSVTRGAFGEAPFDTRERQYGWQNDLDVPYGQLSLAVERREERIDESVGFPVRGRDTNAFVAVLQVRHAAHALQANVRHDRSNQYGGETTGAVAWGWRIAPAWRVTASAANAFKAPSFNDLYFPDFSNPDLRPERARNVEAGVYWSPPAGATRFEVRAVAWRNRVDDLIVFQCDASFACRPENVDDATLTGVTLGADLRWRDTVLHASLDLQDPQDDRTGKLLPRRARQHGSLVVRHAFGAFRLGAEVVASSERYDDAENTRRLAGFAIVNVTAEWDAGRGVTLFARGDNVTDRDYTLAYGYRTPGAQAFVGVRWQP